MQKNSKILCLLVFVGLIHNQIFSEDTQMQQPKRAIVIGATSGMGRAVAKLLAEDGYIMGLVGRRIECLESLSAEIKNISYIKQIDVTTENAVDQLKELIDEMGGFDLMLISISSFLDTRFNNTWEANKKIIDVDLLGFWKMAHTGLEYFEKQGHGHLVGISSLDGLRGSASCPVFSGAKAFITRYLEGVRNKMLQKNIPIYVTDIIPGWVNVEHTVFSNISGTYWVSTKEDAAKQIFEAIKNKKKIAFITKRWGLIALLLKMVPDYIYNRLDKFRLGIGRAAGSANLQTIKISDKKR